MKKEVFQRIFFAFFISFCFLTICSRSSFIYLFNNWDDSNSYFTMGKMMMNGGVIYRDLFDQKGPLLYFIYGLGYLLSHTSFSGVFLIEIISFTIFLLAVYKIANLYLNHKFSMFILPLTAFPYLSQKVSIGEVVQKNFVFLFLPGVFIFLSNILKKIIHVPCQKELSC